MNNTIKKGIATLGIIGVAVLGGASLSADKSNVGKAQLASKFEASEIKSEYVLNDAELVKTNIKNAELDKYRGEPKDEIEVTLGDNSQVALGGLFGAGEKEFKPDIELKRWNEVSFKLKTDKLLADKNDKTVYFEKDKVKFSSDKISFEMYQADVENYKYVWYLNEKPNTNKVEFEIESEGLDFFYQPPLNVANKDPNLTCTETQCKDQDGNIMMERPEDVVGSYAVYHKANGVINDINGKDYKTGKAFHIYRPHLYDASGKEAWGDLNIDVAKGTYTVTIPQDFLDKAIFPIKSNDTFGYTGAGASDYTIYDTRTTTVAVDAPASNGTLTKLTALLKYFNNNAGCVGTAGIYAKGSDPDALLTNGATNEHVAATNPGGTPTSFDFTYTTGPTVTSGGAYALAMSGNDTNGGIAFYVRYDTTSGSGMWYATTVYSAGSLTNPYPKASLVGADNRASIYATYTPSGGGESVYIPPQEIIGNWYK